jgi:putative salt-induced outer membrane protein
MPHRLIALALHCLLTLMVLPSLHAQEDSIHAWHFRADLGLVNTAGNTSTTTLNSSEVASYLTGAWTFTQQGSALYGESDGKKSAESYLVLLRTDYALDKWLGLYLLGQWDRNEFAGISRRFGEGVGLAYKAVALERTALGLEVGFTGNQQRDVTGNTSNFVGGRGAILFRQLLNDKGAYLDQIVEALPNFDNSQDVRINSQTSLVVPLSSTIAFKAGYFVHFDNDPEPGFEKTDRYLTSGLQIVL